MRFFLYLMSSIRARFNWSFLLSIFCPLLFFPQLSVATSLTELYQQALQNDPSFQSVNLQAQIAQEGNRQALAELLPSVIGAADTSKIGQDIVSSDNTVYSDGKADYDTTNYSVTLTQPVFRWNSIVGWQQSKVVQMKAEAEAVVAGQDLIVRVANLYFQALAAKDQLDYILAEQAAVSQFYELAKGRHEMGMIPITDLHDAKARMAANQAQTIVAKNQLDDALQALSEVTGGTIGEVQPLKNDLKLNSPEPNNLDNWTDGALKQNPIIEMQKRAVEAAELGVKRQKTGHYPSLDLVGSFKNEDTGGSLFGGGSEIESLEVGLQLTVPFYQGGGVSSRIRSAYHELDIARQNLIQQNRSVLRKTRSAYLGVNSALSQVEALQESIIANKLALDAKQEGFMSGLFTSLNVLDAERDLSLVSIDCAKARYDYILNSLKLKQAVGSLHEKDLQQLEQWFVQ